MGSKKQKWKFGVYSMPHQGILLEYYHATWICILWCGKLFPDEAHNILPHWQTFMHEKTILLFESLYLFVQMVLVICNINVGGFWKMET
jgi:hypothetical protein